MNTQQKIHESSSRSSVFYIMFNLFSHTYVFFIHKLCVLLLNADKQFIYNCKLSQCLN